MYVPVLQARQSERTAIRRIRDIIVSSGKCTPLFVPVTNSERDISLLARQMGAVKLPYFLLTTPLKPQAPRQNRILAILGDEDGDPQAIPTIATSASIDVDSFRDSVLSLPSERHFAVFHDSEPEDADAIRSLLAPLRERIQCHLFRGDTCTDAYMDGWQADKRINVSDDFNRRRRNQDYGDVPNELYSDLVDRFREQGFSGFGDYTITGDYYEPGGGQPGAVAIHLTYYRRGKGAWIRHFVSERTSRSDDVREKFLDALTQLVEFLDEQAGQLDFSAACHEFRELYDAKHFPGLPALKRLSIQHHIEVMLNLLE